MAPTRIQRLVWSVGMSTFVRYYDVFADENLSNQQVIERLRGDITDKSQNSRTSHARTIFREGLQIQALELIADSKRTDDETIRGANKLLGAIRRTSL